jgi:predicted nucleic acid-binding protein
VQVILAETSIMIDALRPQFQAIRFRLHMEEAVVCGVTKAELLQGIRTPHERVQLMKLISPFPILEIPESVWELTGDLLSQLRAAGTPIPFPDVIQAAVAVEYEIPLWTKDSHFQLIQSVEPRLKLFVP